MASVLIIEDNPINRDVLGRRLERRGFTIHFASDGPSGIAEAKALMPDVILLDIGLGEMDGCETARCLRADPETAALPIIALTASVFESDRIRALAAGCIDFDTKPVDLPRLLGKMEAVLGPKTPLAAMSAG